MRAYWIAGLSCWLLAVSSGCTYRHTQEFSARLDSAENNAATSRLRADEALVRAQRAEETADQALRAAEEAVEQVRLQNKAPRK